MRWTEKYFSKEQNSHTLVRSHSQEVAGLGRCSVEDWEDVYDEPELLVGQQGVQADEDHTGSDQDLQPLVQGNAKRHQEEAGSHGPGQRRVQVPQDGGALVLLRKPNTRGLDTLEVRLGGCSLSKTI